MPRSRPGAVPATVLALLFAALLSVPAAHAIEPATELRLPLDSYPIDDNCGPWGWFNPNFLRCGMPGKHVADDACAPAGTMVYAVGPGRVMHGSQVGNCNTNWGWLTVVEHERPDGSKFCSIYGHCRPLAGILPGTEVEKGQAIAIVEFPCGAQHIHFGIAIGGFDVDLGYYPSWLLGYLPDGITCEGQPTPFPGRYVEPVQFVLDTVPVEAVTWSGVKARER
ncbi:MAG TPA: M23 family metallopeptidase [Candidatus Eisenbacteria bacterium]